MPFWMDAYFMNANTPIMEQMIMLHDHSMMAIFMIMIFLLSIMVTMINSSTYNLNLTENPNIEMIWTIMPMTLLLFIALPSLQILYLMEENYSPSLTIKTIGHQWYWSYEYSELNLNFDSFMQNTPMNKNFRLLENDLYLMLPINTSIRMLVTSADVIHSWTIQSMGVKTDAIPGRLNQINICPSRPGVFFGQCSEICGTNHSFMPISIKISKIKKFIKLINKLSHN